MYECIFLCVWPWFAVARMGEASCKVFALFVMKGHILINEFWSVWTLACVLMWMHFECEVHFG